jgi:thiol:disulfide interchange protein DsbC
MRTRPAILTVAAILLSAVAAPTLGANRVTDVSAAVQGTLKARFPDINVVSVKPTPVSGLYELYTGDNLVYTDAKGDFLIMGPVVDTRSRRNLTSERMDEINAIDFGILPLDRAIKTVKGTGERTLAVFSDPECPYCKQLEKELSSVTDVTIYTFLFPLVDLHPEAPKRSVAIWCAEDRSQAWDQWMRERRLPEDRECDASAIDQNLKLGEELRVSATPTLFTATGRRLSGMHPAAEILKALDAQSK